MTPQEAAELVAGLAAKMDEALADALIAQGRLVADGVSAARVSGVHSLAVADIVVSGTEVGRYLGDAALAMRRFHEFAHEALDTIGLVTPKAGGGGGK